MKKKTAAYFSFLFCLASLITYGQSDSGFSSGKAYDYKILKAYYSEGDSTTNLSNWVDQGLNIHFIPARDSMIISVDIGGKDKVFFMGMATGMDNPGFISTSASAEFYHWIFVSHLKEGVRNAYLMKEYIEGSLEKLGKKNYFIQIAFADQSELQFYGFIE